MTHTHIKPNSLCTQSKGLRTREPMALSSSARQENTNVPSQADEVPPHSCMSAQSLQSCLTLWNPMNCSPPGSSVHGILQARILEWAAIPSSKGSSQPRDWTHVSCIACEFFTPEPPGKLSPLLRLYVLVRPSTHCNLLFSFTHSEVNLIQKHPHRHTKCLGLPASVKLMHKINIFTDAYCGMGTPLKWWGSLLHSYCS